jgi:hypothetical protein
VILQIKKRIGMKNYNNKNRKESFKMTSDIMKKIVLKETFT